MTRHYTSRRLRLPLPYHVAALPQEVLNSHFGTKCAPLAEVDLHSQKLPILFSCLAQFTRMTNQPTTHNEATTMSTAT